MKQPYPNLLSGDKFTMTERDRLIKKYAGRCGFMGKLRSFFLSFFLSRRAIHVDNIHVDNLG
jgi:hypothetical protein